MNTNSASTDWQQALQQAIRDPRELLELLELPPNLLPDSLLAHRQFPLLVPHYFVNLMEKGNPRDPLLLQVLPVAEELIPHAAYNNDPVGDLDAMKQPGVLHKYPGRILLTTTPACAVHCRYCFRRHFPYGEANPVAQNWNKAIEYIQNQSDVSEVILSGGDPLSLSDERLLDLIHKLATIPQLKRLRIHSRQPVMLPARITTELLEGLNKSRFKIIMVIHCNHPRELSAELEMALQKLKRAGITLLNQSVLLRGVNDSASTLGSLSERLFDCGVLPYYLHVLDKVQGAQHFDLPRMQAKQLHAELRNLLPGYLLPRLVTEIRGEQAKTLL